MPRALIALGSNQQNPPEQLKRAISLISKQCELIRLSAAIWTKPVGLVDQAPFFNQIIEVETALTPYSLLQFLLEIEQQMGRTRQQKWGPRCIDLDILTYEQVQISSPDLTIPHPEILHRDFLLYLLYQMDYQEDIPNLPNLKLLIRDRKIMENTASFLMEPMS